MTWLMIRNVEDKGMTWLIVRNVEDKGIPIETKLKRNDEKRISEIMRENKEPYNNYYVEDIIIIISSLCDFRSHK